MKNYSSLNDKIFANSFVESLPGDHSQIRNSRQVPGACYSLIEPEQVQSPKLLAWSDELAEQFALTRPQDNSDDIKILAGNKVAESMRPYAACYGGHQFGQWARQLGDGRAITLGELPNTDFSGQAGEFAFWDLQLKGAGSTPFSRNADGRAVLRSSLREFLASEAMFHLGVPTTRALSLVSTGDPVIRDMFYDGNPRYENGAITARMAPSFLRFGNFEIQAFRQQNEILKKLVDWTINKYFTHLDIKASDVYENFFVEVCKSTAKLMVEWERVGFVHGVMNTDNMSILGLTIDYGPYGWLDVYDPNWTPNTTDMNMRRYTFGKQASVAQWNLRCLAQALVPLGLSPASIEQGLNIYISTYKQTYLKMMAGRLGLNEFTSSQDFKFVSELERIFQLAEVDPTIFYRSLAQLECDKKNMQFKEGGAQSINMPLVEYNYAQIKGAFYEESPAVDFIEAIKVWLTQYAERVHHENLPSQQRITAMNLINPKFIPRNYLLFNAIKDLENGSESAFNNLYKVLKNPYDENLNLEDLAARRPEWARDTPGSSTLSCSS